MRLISIFGSFTKFNVLKLQSNTLKPNSTLISKSNSSSSFDFLNFKSNKFQFSINQRRKFSDLKSNDQEKVREETKQKLRDAREKRDEILHGYSRSVRFSLIRNIGCIEGIFFKFMFEFYFGKLFFIIFLFEIEASKRHKDYSENDMNLLGKLFGGVSLMVKHYLFNYFIII